MKNTLKSIIFFIAEIEFLIIMSVISRFCGRMAGLNSNSCSNRIFQNKPVSCPSRIFQNKPVFRMEVRQFRKAKEKGYLDEMLLKINFLLIDKKIKIV